MPSPSTLLLLLLPFFLLPSLRPTLAAHTCKPLPSSPDWPSPSAWQALNTSLSGTLLSPSPPGAVCHRSWPTHYSPPACAALAAEWTNTSFHSWDPLSVDYNDVTCLPDATAPCSREGYPAYVIDADGWGDVAAGVRFAGERGVRLVVKGTGHDYPGRSSGAGSLLINTHRLLGVEYMPGEARAVALGGVGAVKVYAGMQMRALYGFAAENNITVVLGSDPDVGIGGWVSGAGHSPMSSRFGLGADQVIEMEVVTADGEFRTINAECEADLFWAMRGGGPSTYAVLISVTMKAHPTVPTSAVYYGYKTAASSDAFWSMTAYFHSQIPRLSEAGLMGYYYAYPQLSGETNSSIAGQLFGLFWAPTLSHSRANSAIAAMNQHILSAQWGDKITGGPIIKEYPDFAAFWHKNATAEKAGTAGRLGSRLLNNASLTGDFTQLKNALKETTSAPDGLIGNVVAGPGVRSPPGGIAGGENAVLPAWREAYSHTILPRSWTPLNAADKAHRTTRLRDVEVEALRQISPGSGAYVNEADPTEPNWQETFYGSNYPRLLAVKEKWDPKGVFWCKNCVGNELWSTIGTYGIENGVGQNPVQLCRV